MYELNNDNSGDYNNRRIEHSYDNQNSEQIPEKETLYSVKWYKDNVEFYRYIPKATPQQHSYFVDGIKVNVSRKLIFKLYIFSK